MTRDRFEGCLLGLALGDALGAPHEGGPLERLVWRVIGKKNGKARWTDDTQMSLDLAESLIEQGTLDLDVLARRFAKSYRWSRGYGPGTARLLKRVRRGANWQEASRSVYPDGSYGNGGAMRSPVIGLFYAGRGDELVEAARDTARVTHAHSLGQEGAILLAICTAAMLNGARPAKVVQEATQTCTHEPFTTRLEGAGAWLDGGETPDVKEVRRRLGNGIAAAESCVTAVYVALRFLDDPFVGMLDFIKALGGDVDTIGAMAGALWGAANGGSALPSELLSVLERRDKIVAVAGRLHETCGSA